MRATHIAAPWENWHSVNTGPVIAVIVIIAASGVLMMRFRKRWLAKVSIILTNGNYAVCGLLGVITLRRSFLR